MGTVIEQLHNKQEETKKELETVRRMARTGWLLVFNLPIPFGVSKGNALQSLMEKLGYGKPLFDCDRDLLATDMMYVNKNGLLCNMSFFVCQRHYDYIMSAPFQKKVMQMNKELERGRWISFGRVLSPSERSDFEIAQALKRLIIAKMQEQRRSDPNFQYFTVDEASTRFGLTTDDILKERNKYRESLSSRLADKSRSKLKRPSTTSDKGEPGNKLLKL
ncbi:hypothetical protein ANCCAN_27384 [Ancylostoma caninum]|uniref:Uncharacterized protein n=1 Tax=Ancylostoma caninum TaxID=29170 RepID=A0A368F5M0_ANCCA|nr:hypothetical protein ANCCAN_27384 [Ancylostoma caninum]